MAGNRPSEARYTVNINIRLTEDEKRILQTKAKEFGCSVSQAVRRIIFNKTGAVDRCSDNEMAQQRMQALRGTRAEFKRIAASYSAFIDSYRRSVSLIDRNGNPVVSTELTQRLVSSLEGLTLKLQAALNECLREAGQIEEHSITRMKPADGAMRNPAVPPSGKESHDGADIAIRTDSEELELKLCNMERIMIIGKLTENASRYRTGNGSEKVRFRVNCESIGRNAVRTIRTYNVFCRDTDIAERLKKDISVFVEGTFAVDDNKDLLLFADVVKFASE